MATTPAATGLTPQQWDSKFYREYLQNNRFKPYMGQSQNSIIQIKEDLVKKQGDTLTFALVNRLTGAGVSGSGVLEGNEEKMTSRSYKQAVDMYRNAVVVPKIEEQKSAIGLQEAGKVVNMDWAMEHTRDKIIAALGMINGVLHSAASEAQKDAWLVDNADRVLFGDAIGNGSYTDHSADLATVTAGMTLTADNLSLMKRIALTANPKIRPITVDGGKRYYVVFASPRAFRDLKQDSVIRQAQREVSLGKQNNKLFKGGDIEWDGMIVHEVDDIASLGTVGAASAAVDPVYLCGSQAIAVAYAQRWQTIKETRDYGALKGVGVEAIYDIGKMTFGSGSGDTDDLKDHGVVTGYFGAAADT